MKSIIKASVFVLLLVTLFLTSWANAGGFRSNNIVVLLAGTGTADSSGDQFAQLGLEIPEDLEACFDLDLIDARTGKVIGSGSDCLSGVSPIPTDNGMAMALTATSFFHFSGGTLVSRGLVTVQPKLGDDALPDFTHITGAAPSATDNNIIYGDGKFRNTDGSVRLSGLVNLTNFGSGIIDFDCLFVIETWRKNRPNY